MRFAPRILVVAAFGFATPAAFAQRVPFIGGAATGYDPEGSVVNSGAILDAQAVVSDDRKYVTINARPTNTQLLALRSFSFAGGGNAAQLGFVGGAGRDDGHRDENVLNRPGMTFVSRLED